MTPVLMFRHRGFLVRIVNNGSPSHPYEWTVEPIAPAVKREVKALLEEWNAEAKRNRWRRPLRPRETDPVMIRYYRKARLNGRIHMRFYDPTSMPTARGSCSALEWAIDEVGCLLVWRKQDRPIFNR